MLTDIEIAQRANIKPIKEIAKSLGIDENDLDFYGKYKAKIKDFTYFTFYDSEMEYENDRQDNWKRLRKLLISRSIESMFSRSSSEIYAYMAPDTVVSGENIIKYPPAEEF